MGAKIVKSAGRIFEILELFNREQRPMPAIEISDKLGYPLASTHEILKTMVQLGYFTYGTPKWAYIPSAKLPELVSWVQDQVPEDQRLHLFMEALNKESLETVQLARRTWAQVKIIKSYPCQHDWGVSVKTGSQIPIVDSLAGLVSLANMASHNLQPFLRRLEHDAPNQFQQLDMALLADIREEHQQTGSVMRPDLMSSGIASICVAFKSEAYSGLVTELLGPSNRIRQQTDRHKETISRLLTEFEL